MKINITRLSIFLICQVISIMAYGQLEVLYTPEIKPTIDGIIDANDPWQADEWIAQLAFTDASTTFDVNSQFQLLWDDNNLYLAVQVKDATPNNDSETSYNNDCIEAYFHMSGSSVTGTEVAYDASTSQLRWPRSETTHTMDGSPPVVESFDIYPDAQYAVVSDSEGWVLEVSLPISLLDQGGLFDGENMMFEINTSDNTGVSRTGQIFWQDNSDNQWRYVEAFSPVHLVRDTVSTNIAYYFKESYSMCKNEVYSWQGNDYTNTGRYYAKYPTINGEDSIYQLDLNVTYFFFPENVAICASDTLDWHGKRLSKTGSYYDSLLTINGCDSIYEMKLTVRQKPDSFDILGLNKVEAFQVATYSVPNNNDLVYTWVIKNGNLISSPSNNSVEVQWSSAGTGPLAVVANNSIGCKSDSSILLIDIRPTEIREFLSQSDLLYPNPAKRTITISNIKKPSDFDIIDICGKVLLSGFLPEGSNEIDLSRLKNGIYFIRIENDAIHKIIKQ